MTTRENLRKIARYERRISRSHYSDIHAALAGCAAQGDGNYRVTLDTHPPTVCNDGSGRPWKDMPVYPQIFQIEVRNGEAEQV